MRKKYLSALLFGALLVTSAGTFTSCKDYDDEINDLQTQIDKVVTDLTSLKTTVESLGGYVTDVKIEGGKLVVTVDGKEPVSYELPANAEMAEIEIKDGHLFVDGVDKGEVSGSKVEVNEEGVLVIDGKATEIKVGTEVVIKDNANGVCTIKIGEEEVQLATAASFVTIQNIDGTTFTDLESVPSGIYWGKAADKVDWKGPKGSIAKDQLLFGQISTVQVSVLPAAYDLSKQELKLVNSKGEDAPVTVEATAADELLTSGSRASSNNLYDLTITMKSDATEKSFANKDNSENVLYALSVNGAIVTGYQYIVDTQASKAASIASVSDANCMFGETAAEDNAVEVEMGTTTFKYVDSKVYDYYIEIADADVNDAEVYGISVENNTIVASEKAAGKSIKLNVNIVDVNGTTKTGTITLTVKGTTVAPEEIEASTYKVTPMASSTDKKSLVLNLGDTFSGLTAEQAVAVTTLEFTTEDTKFLLTTQQLEGSFGLSNSDKLSFYEDEAGKKPVVITTADKTANIKKVKFAKLFFNNYNPDATSGKYTITMTLKGATGEIKKVNIPVDVTLPTFDELFTKTTKWDEAGMLNLRLQSSSSNTPVINFNQAYTAKAATVATNSISYSIDNVSDKEVTTSVSNGSVTLNKANIVDEDDNLVVKALTVQASYEINGVKGFTVKSDKFTTNIKSIFEGATLVYYKDNVEQEYASVNSSNEIAALTTTTDNKKNGLAIKFGNDVKAILTGSELDGVKLAWNKTILDENEVEVQSTIDVIGMNGLSADLSSGAVKFIGTLEAGDHGSIKVYFEDATGIATSSTIKFQK